MKQKQVSHLETKQLKYGLKWYFYTIQFNTTRILCWQGLEISHSPPLPPPTFEWIWKPVKMNQPNNYLPITRLKDNSLPQVELLNTVNVNCHITLNTGHLSFFHLVVMKCLLYVCYQAILVCDITKLLRIILLSD